MMLVMMLAMMLAVLFSGCQTRITGTLNSAGRAELKVDAALQPKISILLKKLTAAGSGTQDAPLINAAALNNSFHLAPGIESAAFSNKGKNGNAVEGTLVIARIDELVTDSAAKTDTKFIRWQQNTAGGNMLIHLDRENGPAVISAISPDLFNYLTALAAPLATGEESSRQEYLNLVRMLYDANIADEIAASSIKITLRLPARPTSIQGGVINGNNAEFTIPLAGILVLEKPLDYEIRWGER